MFPKVSPAEGPKRPGLVEGGWVGRVADATQRVNLLLQGDRLRRRSGVCWTWQGESVLCLRDADHPEAGSKLGSMQSGGRGLSVLSCAWLMCGDENTPV